MTASGAGMFAAIYAAAAVEGEIVFVAASVLVASGTINPALVLVAGALGAATGDQFFFYALRANAQRWGSRIPGLSSRRDVIVARVRRHQIGMILAVRFAPGLRIAIAAACALAGVQPLRFTVLNTLSRIRVGGAGARARRARRPRRRPAPGTGRRVGRRLLRRTAARVRMVRSAGGLDPPTDLGILVPGPPTSA